VRLSWEACDARTFFCFYCGGSWGGSSGGELQGTIKREPGGGVEVARDAVGKGGELCAGDKGKGGFWLGMVRICGLDRRITLDASMAVLLR
jgi:hypothetical protein